MPLPEFPSDEHTSRALSPRQHQIAALVAQGYPTKAIGATLHISPWTVATHLRRLYLRFGVSTRAAMIARLLEYGLLDRTTAGYKG